MESRTQNQILEDKSVVKPTASSTTTIFSSMPLEKLPEAPKTQPDMDSWQTKTTCMEKLRIDWCGGNNVLGSICFECACSPCMCADAIVEGNCCDKTPKLGKP